MASWVRETFQWLITVVHCTVSYFEGKLPFSPLKFGKFQQLVLQKNNVFIVAPNFYMHHFFGVS